MIRFGVASLVVLSGCSEGVVLTSVEHGAAIVDSASSSDSTANAFACTTCHAEDSQPWLPGAPLRGSVGRPTYWGGEELDVLASINPCRFLFMGASRAWTADDTQAKSVYAYPDALQGEPRGAVAFSVVRTIGDVPLGDRQRGASIFVGACQNCHGLASTGVGRLKSTIPILPQDTVREHRYLGSRTETRLAVIEKVRHGTFLGYGGVMPPFSLEVLSDAALGDVLAFLDLGD